MRREPVTAVTWSNSSADEPLSSGVEEAGVLISLASDGRLLMWRWKSAELLYG